MDWDEQKTSSRLGRIDGIYNVKTIVQPYNLGLVQIDQLKRHDKLGPICDYRDGRIENTDVTNLDLSRNGTVQKIRIE